MARFKDSSRSWITFVLIVFPATLPSTICTESQPRVHLEYICAEPVSVPEKEWGVPVIMLHGVIDVKETWNEIYKNVSTLTNRKVCIYDARNHGGSSWNDKSGIDAMLEDLEYFMNVLKMERAFLVGHSMGGHTAMKFALTKPGKVDGIFVEDIGIYVPLLVETVVGYIVRKFQKSLSAIPQGADELTAKKAVQNYMMKVTKQQPPSQNYFKVLPLYLHNGMWKWKTNFMVIEEMLDNIHLHYPKLEGKYEGKVLFIYGRSSPFRVWEQEEDIRKLFPNVKFVGLEGADHFIHFNRAEFVKELLDFLK